MRPPTSTARASAENDYIALSGGLTARADKGRIYVIRADGSVAANKASKWFGRGDASILPGDTIWCCRWKPTVSGR